MFFKHSEKTEIKELPKQKTAPKKEEKVKAVEDNKLIDSASTIKTDSVIVNKIEKGIEIPAAENKEIEKTKENKTNLEPKVETSLTKESIKEGH